MAALRWSPEYGACDLFDLTEVKHRQILGYLLEADVMRDIAAGRAPIAVRVFQPSLIGLHRQECGLPLVIGAEAATRPLVAKLQQVPSRPAFRRPLCDPSLVRDLGDVYVCWIGRVRPPHCCCSLNVSRLKRIDLRFGMSI